MGVVVLWTVQNVQSIVRPCTVNTTPIKWQRYYIILLYNLLLVVFYGLTIDGLTMDLVLEFYGWAYYGHTIRI